MDEHDEQHIGEGSWGENTEGDLWDKTPLMNQHEDHTKVCGHDIYRELSSQS